VYTETGIVRGYHIQYRQMNQFNNTQRYISTGGHDEQR